MVSLKLKFTQVLLVFYLVISLNTAWGGEENDLWLLISSYEDIGITVQDLAFFLATHGYDAEPNKSYVTVELSSGTKMYLTPNGAAPRLADLWDSPPKPSGPVMVIPADVIQKNVTYVKTVNKALIRDIRQYAMFPVTPLGMCYDGSEALAEIYESFGYDVGYMYDPSEWDWQGHLWVVVEDPDDQNTWLAVDSYYGIMSENEYYSAPYSFTDMKYLDSINPKWRLM